MKVRITAAKLIATVRRIVKARPDTKYEEMVCHYVKGQCSDGSFGCLLGQAFKELKVKRNFGRQQMGIVIVLEKLGVKTKMAQARWLSTVQRNQDRGSTWENAVLTADMKWGKEGLKDDSKI